MSLRVLTPAQAEIAAAANWFDEQRAGLGDEFWRSVDKVLGEIELDPRQFAKSDFATELCDIRFALVPRFHYVVHFVVGTDEVQVVSVAHAARRPGYWLTRIHR